VKLAAQNVRTLIPDTGKTDQIFWDDAMPSFGVRVRDGRRTFVIQYRVNGQQRRESLGDVRKVKLADAQDIASKRFAQVELGVDPGADKAKARRKTATAALTLSKIAERHLASKQDIMRPSSLRASQRNPRFHNNRLLCERGSHWRGPRCDRPSQR
jgi:hypothetical protein